MLRYVLSFGLFLGLVVAASGADEKETEASRLTRRGASRAGRGDAEGALADFTKALELKPDYAPAYVERGNFQSGLNKHKEAIADYDKALQLDPKLWSAFSGRAFSEYQLNDYAASVKDYEACLSIHPDEAWIWDRLGVSLEGKGDLESALARYADALKLDPTMAMSYASRGEVFVKLGRAREAVAEWSKVIELQPTLAQNFNKRGLCRAVDDDLEGAIADFSLALKVDPKFAFAYENRFVALSRLGREAEAKQDRDTYLQLNPQGEDNVKALQENFIPVYRRSGNPKTSQDYVTRGNALFGVSYYLQAAHDFQRAVELDEFNADAMYNLGLTLKNNNCLEAAISAFRKCLQVDERFYYAMFELGEHERSNLNHHAESIPYFRKAITIKADYAAAHACLGCALRDTGDVKGGIAELTRAVEIEPQYSFAWCSRGEAQFKLGSMDAAIADFAKALELLPTYSFALQARGRAHAAKKNYAAAMADFDESLKQNNLSWTHLYRGLALVQAGKDAEAKKDFDEALTLYPGIKGEMDQELAKLKPPAAPAKNAPVKNAPAKK